MFVLDDNGNVGNREDENTCSCYLPPETQEPPLASSNDHGRQKSMTGCMECGKPIQYLNENKVLTRSHCGLEKTANAVPGAIVAAYRNLGGAVDQHIITAIERGKTIPGGTCGLGLPLGSFWKAIP